MQTIEEWLPVVGYEDIYSVSSFGRVRRDRGTRGAIAGRILAERPDTKGYLRIALYDGFRRDRSVHQLVAEAFIGTRPDGCVVNHIDGVKRNNTPVNLEYITLSGNTQHAHDRGLAYSHRGSQHGRSKLTEDQVSAIRRSDEPVKVLCERYGVKKSMVYYIRAGRYWLHVS